MRLATIKVITKFSAPTQEVPIILSEKPAKPKIVEE
jgi:hypothetical protein